MTTDSFFDHHHLPHSLPHLNPLSHHYPLPSCSASSSASSSSSFLAASAHLLRDSQPAAFASPGSFGSAALARMESTFCKNFVCCSIPLDDLHDLLEHFEQAHCHPSAASAHDANARGLSLGSGREIVFEDEEEWSGTEAGSPASTRLDSRPHPSWLALDHTFGIPPSLLDGHHALADPDAHMRAPDAPSDASASNRPTLDQPGPEAGLAIGSGASKKRSREWQAGREKPFKCSVPGCEKAYKQQNGLKYHKAHGHCSQRALSAEEESKTFVCHDTVCGKRYKNINGLRYHYQHTGPHGVVGLELLALGIHPPTGAAEPAVGGGPAASGLHRHPLLGNCTPSSSRSSLDGPSVERIAEQMDMAMEE